MVNMFGGVVEYQNRVFSHVVEIKVTPNSLPGTFLCVISCEHVLKSYRLYMTIFGIISLWELSYNYCPVCVSVG